MKPAPIIIEANGLRAGCMAAGCAPPCTPIPSIIPTAIGGIIPGGYAGILRFLWLSIMLIAGELWLTGPLGGGTAPVSTYAILPSSSLNLTAVASIAKKATKLVSTNVNRILLL